MTSMMKLPMSSIAPKPKSKQSTAKKPKSRANSGVFVSKYLNQNYRTENNIAKPFTFTGRSEVPVTGIAPTGYAGGGLGGPGINLDNVREFLTELDAFEKEFGYVPDKDANNYDLKHKKNMYKELETLSSINYNKCFYGLVPNDPKNRYYYGMKTDKYYGYAKPNIPDNNKGSIINGVFFPEENKQVDNAYYKRQMAANEFKDYAGPRVLANNERPEDEQLDPRIIDTANFILQHQEKIKQRLRDKYRKNNIAFK